MNRWKSGILGLAVADALGVPVEFMSREQIVKNPVTDMREYGTHNQPKGTWSDDSSMVFATMDSLAKVNAVDYKDLMERFVKWAQDGEYTPFGEVFDIGISTSRAILAYGKGTEPLNCGGDEKVGRGRHGGHITMYQPTLEYDWKGFKRTLRMDAWDSTAHYQIGDKIVLLVDSDNPSHYRYKNIFQEPAAKMIIGVLIMIAIIMIAKRK